MDKNNNSEERIDLKHADMDKFGTDPLNSEQADNSDLLRRERKARDRQMRAEDNANKKKSGRIPLGVDIAIAVLIVALVAGAIVGVYFALKYYTDGYRDVSLQYTVIATGDNAAEIMSLKDKTLYLDTEENSFSMGKVSSVKKDAADNGAVQYTMVIVADTQYRRGEGYLISGNRVAVGSRYILRFEEQEFAVTVVEASEGGRR